ncbi:MAG: hypothetical protein HQK89_05140 [Nitrospirae bacterium]|nr:hypothetical protein [Nitrospirota bacterium]
MEDKTRRCPGKSTLALGDTFEYSIASIEYSGLVIYSFIKRGSEVFFQPMVKVTAPAWYKTGNFAGNMAGGIYRKAHESLKKSLGSVKGLKRLFTGKEERLMAIEQKLTAMDTRLGYLERHGVMATKEGLRVKGKKLTDEKMMFLKTIVSENIDLRVEE